MVSSLVGGKKHCVVSFVCLLGGGVCVSSHGRLTVVTLCVISWTKNHLITKDNYRACFVLFSSPELFLLHFATTEKRKEKYLNFFTISGLSLEKKNSSRPWRHRHIVLLFDIYTHTEKNIRWGQSVYLLFSFFSYLQSWRRKKMVMMGVKTKQPSHPFLLYVRLNHDPLGPLFLIRAAVNRTEPLYDLPATREKYRKKVVRVESEKCENSGVNISAWIDAGEWKWSESPVDWTIKGRPFLCVDAVWRELVGMMMLARAQMGDLRPAQKSKQLKKV